MRLGAEPGLGCEAGLRRAHQSHGELERGGGARSTADLPWASLCTVGSLGFRGKGRAADTTRTRNLGKGQGTKSPRQWTPVRQSLDSTAYLALSQCVGVTG